MSFEPLGLSPRLLKGVEAMGYTAPTPIQEQAIPYVLAGRDVLGIAQTGTGKTAAFVLPTLDRTPTKQGVKALIVTPTRELALQIAEVTHAAGRRTGHRYAALIGGVGLRPQIEKLRRGVDVVIACPGRLLDLHSQGHVDLSRVETLVLDEADRMLDMGFWPDVKRILALVPAKRQNLLFSATMSPEVLRVVEDTLSDPIRVEVSPPATPVDRIAQTVYPVARDQKTDLLVEILRRNETPARTLVFTRTKHRADRLHRQLTRHGIVAGAIHGDRSQNQRQKALDEFKSGRSHVLVATDVVARGIDVDGITHVVNYDMPNTPEDYVHRIGRTARAGADGIALSFLSEEEHERLQEIEGVLGDLLACEDLEGFTYAPRAVPSAERPVGKSRPQPQGSRRAGRRGGRSRSANRSTSGKSW